MSARPKTGIRRIDDLDGGGRLAWLYGETDLDDVLLELARTHDELWIDTTTTLRDGAEWPNDRSQALIKAAAPGEGNDVWLREYRAAHVTVINEDHPTDLGSGSTRDVEVGWYRRMPWCHCGDGHNWHWEPSAPGRGASLAVLIESGW